MAATSSSGRGEERERSDIGMGKGCQNVRQDGQNATRSCKNPLMRLPGVMGRRLRGRGFSLITAVMDDHDACAFDAHPFIVGPVGSGQSMVPEVFPAAISARSFRISLPPLWLVCHGRCRLRSPGVELGFCPGCPGSAGPHRHPGSHSGRSHPS